MPRWFNQVSCEAFSAAQANIAGPCNIYGAGSYLHVSVESALNGVTTIGDSASDELHVIATEEESGPRGAAMVPKSRMLDIGDTDYNMAVDDMRDYYFLYPLTTGKTFRLALESAWDGLAIWIVNRGSESVSINNMTGTHYGDLPAGYSVHYVGHTSAGVWELVAVVTNTYPA